MSTWGFLHIPASLGSAQASGSCARGTTPCSRFVTSGQWKNAPCGLRSADNEHRHRSYQASRARRRGAAGPAAHRRGHGHAAPGEPGRLRLAPRRGAGGQAPASRRAADPGGTGTPVRRRAMQAYLAAAESAEGVVAEAGLDEADSQRVGFVLTNLIDALAPSNNPLLNPAAVKAAVDTGGGSAVAGPRPFLRPKAGGPRGPAPVA